MQTQVVQEQSDQPLPEILQNLQAENAELHREALEKLAFYFMEQLRLEFKAWRKRGDVQGKTEVEAIAESTYPIFSRWQIYCKNAPDCKIFDDDIATEVGLAIWLKSDVIFIVTTGLISRNALSYADSMIGETNLNIITIGGKELQILATSPQSLVDMLEKKARRRMKLREARVH